ncbi:hypothetical protein CONLIGDRAFT_643104 [Coniochaeta ligniaria NRRL 30616]|uniref:C2H2-type domain-containing protein n=1 Tax=Coniochaeta ligniaria NRRL 30616 TaxID=1408157 RepID=A0A1J7JP18_9PEZI|nr:hypothetical protein CONLIGDRAFT_643104 [Coniochaeta ligniaria NRRL 30616]
MSKQPSSSNPHSGPFVSQTDDHSNVTDRNEPRRIQVVNVNTRYLTEDPWQQRDLYGWQIRQAQREQEQQNKNNPVKAFQIPEPGDLGQEHVSGPSSGSSNMTVTMARGHDSAAQRDSAPLDKTSKKRSRTDIDYILNSPSPEPRSQRARHDGPSAHQRGSDVSGVAQGISSIGLQSTAGEPLAGPYLSRQDQGDAAAGYQPQYLRYQQDQGAGPQQQNAGRQQAPNASREPHGASEPAVAAPALALPGARLGTQEGRSQQETEIPSSQGLQRGEESGETEKFTCEFCKKTFERKGDLKRHVSSIHTHAHHLCTEKACYRSILPFRDADALQGHIARGAHVYGPIYVCETCKGNRRRSTPENKLWCMGLSTFREHMQSVHHKPPSEVSADNLRQYMVFGVRE